MSRRARSEGRRGHRACARLAIFALQVSLLGPLGCDVFNKIISPSTPTAKSGPLFFPIDRVGDCVLQKTSAESASDAATWTSAGDLSDRPFDVVAHEQVEPRSGSAYVVVKVRDTKGQTFWVRRTSSASVPQKDPTECAVPLASIATMVTPIRATSVRLVPTVPSCHGLDLLSGDAHDVDFQPYSVLWRRLYRTSKGPTLGVTLSSESGASLHAEGETRLVTVSSEQFNGCFASTSRPALAVDRRQSVFDWLAKVRTGGSAEPPAVPLDAALVLLGVDEKSCLREGRGDSQHRECRAAAMGVARGDGAATDQGVHALTFVRERIVDAVHGYGDALIAPAEVAGVNFVVNAPRGKSAAFGKAFDAALTQRVTNPDLQARRGARGYRLLRASDIAKFPAPYDAVEVEASFTASPPTEPQATPASDTPPAGAAAAAVQPSAGEQAALDGNLAAGFALEAPACIDATAPAVCNVALGSRAASLLAQRAATVQAAERAKEGGSAPVPRASDLAAVPMRRRGEVVLKLASRSHEGPEAAGPTPMGKTRAPVALPEAIATPTVAELDRAAARASVDALDAALEMWMARSVAHPPPDSLLPGTRAYMTLLARHVASNRRVKLVTDLLDTRTEDPHAGKLIYPIRLPDGSGALCYTFVAAASDGAPAEVKLVLRRAEPDATSLVGRDARLESVAGFEVCNPAAGAYALEVALAGPVRPAGVVVSMFESTPDKVSESDARASLDGAPTALPLGAPHPATTSGPPPAPAADRPPSTVP